MLVTPESIANEVRLARTQTRGPFLITEGPLDSRLYRRVLHQSCVTIVAFGRTNVKAAIGLLEGDGIRDSVGIVDADFESLRGGPDDQENLLRTDMHDIETMLLMSEALDKVLETFGSEGKIRGFVAASKATVRDGLFGTALPLGLLRWISERDGLDLTFDGLSMTNFTDRRTLRVDPDAMVNAVINRSSTRSARVEDVRAALAALSGISHDPSQVCCGPDVVSILSLGLTSALGSRRAIEVSPDSILRALELSYESAWFAGTGLHARLRQWQMRTGLQLTR